jgi:hypothetical protein
MKARAQPLIPPNTVSKDQHEQTEQIWPVLATRVPTLTPTSRNPLNNEAGREYDRSKVQAINVNREAN